MTDLSPITALGARAPKSARHGALTITENSGLALASLTLRRGMSAPDIGLELPGPGRCGGADGMAAFWIAPDQWMIEAEGRAETDFSSELKSRASECSITEQTDGFVAFEIASSESGASIQALMEKLINIEPAAFAPGRASRTGLEHMSVFIIRRTEKRLAVIGMRTLAGSLWHALETAAKRLQKEMK